MSADAKLEVDEESYLSQFKPHLMDVIFAWANGATFAQICKMTDVFEGSFRMLINFLSQSSSCSSYFLSFLLFEFSTAFLRQFRADFEFDLLHVAGFLVPAFSL